MGICCSWGVFLFWHELLEHGLPRKEILEHVLHSHVHISPAALEFRQPQGPASACPPQLHSWKLELFGHQLFPVLRENNKQASKTKQEIRFLFGSHQLLRTVVFTWEKLEKVSRPFQIAKQAAQPLRLQYCQGVKVPKKQIFRIPLSSLQCQASWTVFVPQEKRKKWRMLYFRCRQEPHY